MASILIVDDDQGIVRLMSRILEAERLTVFKAFNGEEGLAYLQDGQDAPDLILLDLAMPGMDGIEFYRRARADGYAGPVVVCSSYGAAAAKHELGAENALDKPFDPDELVAMVEAELALR